MNLLKTEKFPRSAETYIVGMGAKGRPLEAYVSRWGNKVCLENIAYTLYRLVATGDLIGHVPRHWPVADIVRSDELSPLQYSAGGNAAKSSVEVLGSVETPALQDTRVQELEKC